jgi:hypothetical protein
MSVPVPTNAFAVHVIVVVPGATAVAKPVDALIVATLGLLLVQPEDAHAGEVLPKLSLKTAENCWVVLTGAPIVNGDTVIEFATNTKMLPDPLTTT